MALTLQVTYKGETASYWAVIENRSDYIEGTTRVVLGLYRNQAAYETDKSNVLDRRTYTLTGVDYTLDDLYVELVKPKPVLLTPASGENPAVYAESNPFAVAQTEAEAAATATELAIDKLWHFVDAFGEQQFDRNYRERCLAWLADPTSSATRLARIAELWAWGDTFWAEFYRVKTLILAGDLDASFSITSIAPCPYNIAEIAGV